MYLQPEHRRAVAYVLLNLLSGTGIVFANKLVLSVLNFHYVYALTFIHSVVTMFGLWGFAAASLFEVKVLGACEVLPLAMAFVGYVVLWNLSLQLNPVGFYQLAKIAITPAIIAIEAAFYAKRPTYQELAAVGVLSMGVMLATVVDAQVTTNTLGLVAAVLAVLCTAVYQVWAGTKQRELGAGSMQLMHQFQPYAAGLLALLVVGLEPLGLPHAPHELGGGTLLGYRYSLLSVAAILITAVLGLLVSLSTFLVIGATSSVTFNVVANIKTVTILAGGYLLFDEAMPPEKLTGVVLGMLGIVWYSYLKINAKTVTAKEAVEAAAADAEAAKPLNSGKGVPGIETDIASDG